MLRKVLIGVVVLAAAFAAYVATLPSGLLVARNITIAAPPAAVFGHVNDFRKWEHWSPWAKLDPDAKATFEGPAEGQGAVFRWSGNDDVGEGKMTITESTPAENIKLKLEFTRPFEDSGDVEFTFDPDGDTTIVTWILTGEKGFAEKLVGVFMNMEEMIGADYEKGLANLKSVVEGKGT